MKINEVNSGVTFKSGYPMFGVGHLSFTPDKYDLIYLGFRSTGILKQDHKLDYNA